MDHARVSCELLRAWRGRRSQAQLSRKLGYRSNVVFDWESGRRAPTAANALRLAECVGVNVQAALERFHQPTPGWKHGIVPASPEGVRQLMLEMKGKQSIAELCSLLGRNRFVIGRWLAGATEPKLPDFLVYVDKVALRLLDFISVLISPSALPSLTCAWQKHVLARELAYEVPWSHAVLRALELSAYRDLPRHRPGFIAQRLGLERAEEEHALSLLERAGQIRFRNRRWQLNASSTLDTRQDPQRSRKLRAHWSRVAALRLEEGCPGEFAFNLFGVSKGDLERLKELQRTYFRELRSIVARSEPVEEVVLVNLQLVPLGPRPSR